MPSSIKEEEYGHKLRLLLCHHQGRRLAQQESQSLSQNVKFGLQYRYQQGKVQANHNRFLGYTKDEDHCLCRPLHHGIQARHHNRHRSIKRLLAADAFAGSEEPWSVIPLVWKMPTPLLFSFFLQISLPGRELSLPHRH